MSANAVVVVVVGSVNVDMIVRAERLPRPGETVVGGEFVSAGGGKGANQAMAAHRLGADVRFVGRVGRDAWGDAALAGFAAEGLPTTWVSVDSAAATGVALIMVDRGGQNLIAVSPGANHRLTRDALRAAEPAFVGAGVLLVQLEIPIETAWLALEMARAHGLATVLNPAPSCSLPDGLLRLVDWATPNEVEAVALTDLDVVDLHDAERAARSLLARGPSHVVVTLGDRGAVHVTGNGAEEISALSVQAVDATAAGDAFSAALAVGLARGLPPSEALRYASAAGACAATRPGAQPSLPTHAEVTALLARTPVQRLEDRSRG